MTKPAPVPEDFQASGQAPDYTALPLAQANAHKLIQELQLHKIELEMQNEELLRIQEELRTSWKQIDNLVVERTTELSRAEASLSVEIRQRRELEAALQESQRELELLRRQVAGR
jgi:C4-dicarboxylate-specific signal transduction histidine kinase